MSKLQKTLDALSAQEAGANNPCYSTNQQVSALVVEASTGRRWMLPWQHFLNGQHDDASDGETLLLCFATHEVVVSGRNLGPLADEIAHFRLEILRAAPGKYGKPADAEPFVAQIEVRLSPTDSAPEKSQKTRVLS